MAVIALSIIVISKDDLDGFRKTIESIQPYIGEQVELILVIADGKAAYKDFIKSIQYSTLIYNEDDGLYSAMNIGISHSRGGYINFLNGGDAFANEKPLLSYITKLSGDLVCFNVIRNGKVIKPGLDEVHPHQGVFYSAKLIKQNTYDDSFRIHGDMEHWYRINKKYRLDIHKHKLIYADFEGGGIGEKLKYTSAYELFRIGLRYKRIFRVMSALNRLI